MTGATRLWLALALLVALSGAGVRGQEQPSPLDDTIDASEADGEPPARKLIRWNEFDGPFMTVRAGGGFLMEYAAYAQDDSSKAQFSLHPDERVRDARALLSGRLKFKRDVTWSMGLMYDGPTDKVLWRQSGLMVAVPEIWGHIFVGRTKEGISLNKIMVGYHGWTQERATMNDATVPILADGVKWLGYSSKARVLWNVGFYGDWLSEKETFSTYDNQVVGRVAWVPMVSPTGGKLLHVGVAFRHGTADAGQLRLRSRPEAFPAPYFVETPKFDAKGSDLTQVEAYYRPGPLLVGTEYFFQKVDADGSGDPFFHGGEVAVSWLATGETRPYNTRGGYFNAVSPARPVFQGGPGAWELVARFSYIDLEDDLVHGGRFWRITPMANWHLSDNVRLEMTYGYGMLDRFDLRGHTQFFQTRLQLSL